MRRRYLGVQTICRPVLAFRAGIHRSDVRAESFPIYVSCLKLIAHNRYSHRIYSVLPETKIVRVYPRSKDDSKIQLKTG